MTASRFTIVAWDVPAAGDSVPELSDIECELVSEPEFRAFSIGGVDVSALCRSMDENRAVCIEALTQSPPIAGSRDDHG